MIECKVCHSKFESPNSKTVSKAYDRHRSTVSSKTRALNILLVVGDCVLVGLQPILVYMSKVDGGFNFSPISVNLLTEAAKVVFAVVMLLLQARHKKLYFNPATVKMLSNMKFAAGRKQRRGRRQRRRKRKRRRLEFFF